MKIKDVLLGILIAVIFVMFCAYGTNLFYQEPAYENFCNSSYPYPAETPNSTCIFNSQIQEKTDNCYSQNGVPRYQYDANGCEKDLNCDFCGKEFTSAQEDYAKNLFLISLIFSLAIILISVLAVKTYSISGGLMLGSLFFIIYGTAKYWGFMEDVLRFIILGIVLIVLIWLAYHIAKKNKDERNINKKRLRR
jgi:uncharacterized membrane protein